MDSRFNTASLEFKGQAIGLMSKEEFARTSTLEDEPSIEEQEKAKVGRTVRPSVGSLVWSFSWLVGWSVVCSGEKRQRAFSPTGNSRVEVKVVEYDTKSLK